MAHETAILVEGLAIGESPRWHDGRLWLCEWGTGRLLSVDEAGRVHIELERDPAIFPFSADWLPDGRMLLTTGPEGLVLREETDGALVTHADLRPLSDKPWHEIVVDQHGNAYVGGINFDLMGGEAPAPGVIALVAPDGSSRLVAEGLSFPNGIALAAAGRTLIVAESYVPCLTAFDVAPDGTLSGRRVWASLGIPPDGICVDADGAVWVASMGGLQRVREGGDVLDEVPLDRGCFACVLGGPDGRTLYVAAAEWHGPERFLEGRTGQVVTLHAPAPRAGRP